MDHLGYSRALLGSFCPRALLAAGVLAAGALPTLASPAGLMPSPAYAQAESAAYCEPGEVPSFRLGLAALKERVGDQMGAPTECEHANPENGDLLQGTTTGLAYYRTRLNMPAFTTGVETWALSPTGRGLILWTGGSVDPPQPRPEEDAFFRRWLPVLDRELAVSDAIGPIDTTLATGRFDTIDPADVRAAFADLRAVQADFAALGPPPRLVRGHALWLERIDGFADYLELVLEALESPNPAARAELLERAERDLDRSVQASRDANTAIDAILPREIDQLRQAGFEGAPAR